MTSRSLDKPLGKSAPVLLVLHAAALVFGLAGMLIALPNPGLWSSNPLGTETFQFGMTYAGSLHILLGAAAMAVFGVLTLGWRNTLIFFLAAVVLSLSSELIGTGTGWPFGNYEYTSGLGAKVLGRVPFSIPLSWFYMGFASCLLGSALAAARGLQPLTPWALGLGVYFLTVWDLVLDPAMAHQSLPIHFWLWHSTGPYFGMPVQNFLGWSATGLLFMSLSRWSWGRPPSLPTRVLWFPVVVYGLNTAFAMVLSAAAGLWGPVLLALVLGLVPALIAVRSTPRATAVGVPAPA